MLLRPVAFAAMFATLAPAAWLHAQAAPQPTRTILDTHDQSGLPGMQARDLLVSVGAECFCGAIQVQAMTGFILDFRNVLGAGGRAP